MRFFSYMIAQQLSLDVGDFVWTGGDVHIYNNHQNQVKLQLSRTPRPLPQLQLLLPAPASLFDYRYEDFTLNNYDPWPAIKAPVAV